MPLYWIAVRPPEVEDDALPQSQLGCDVSFALPQTPSDPVELSVVQSTPDAFTSRSPGDESVTEWSPLVLLCVSVRLAWVTVAEEVRSAGKVNLINPLEVNFL